MAATATTDIINALRYTYGVDRVLYLATQEVPLFNVLQRTKKDMGGRGQFLMPILTTNPGAWTGIAQGGALPTALNPATSEASYALKEFVGIYELSWKLIQDSRASKFAFQQAIQMMDDGLRRRVFRLINADLLGTGRGELGILPAADNTDPVTVRALPLAEPGIMCDIVATSDDNTKRLTNQAVSAVDVANRTVAFGGNNASGTATGDFITIASTVATGSVLHMNGIRGIIDAANPGGQVANIGGIDRSAGTAVALQWQSPQLANGGTNRVLTEDLMLQAEDLVRERGGARLTNWFMNLAIGRRYHELLRADTFYTMGSAKPIGGGLGRAGGDGSQGAGPDGDGSSPYEFSGVNVNFDPFFDANQIVEFDRSHFFLGVGDNDLPRPISEIFDNIPFFRQTANATFQVAWYWQAQLLTDNPAAGVKIKDVAES
jgi:hypothetical protein